MELTLGYAKQCRRVVADHPHKLTDAFGETPRDYAERAGLDVVVEQLEACRAKTSSRIFNPCYAVLTFRRGYCKYNPYPSA
jgi:hypothetical protein